jgi:hypothetical protein
MMMMMVMVMVMVKRYQVQDESHVLSPTLDEALPGAECRL